MVGQYLSNTNENATVPNLANLEFGDDLNKALGKKSRRIVGCSISSMVVPMDHETGALNRVRAFTGGIMIMAYPVLLANAVHQVNPKTESCKLARCIIWMTALTLEAGIFPLVGLCLSNATADIYPRIPWHFFAASKLLVHLCAILLMALAYGILLLISMDNLLYVCPVIVFVFATLWHCYLSVQNNPVADLTNTSDGDRRNQVEFSVAGTSILFLGLEGFALERLSHSATTTPPSPLLLDRGLLKASLGLSFVTCLFGVFVMLRGVVPVTTGDRGATRFVERLNIALAISIGVAVILITAAAVKMLACLVVVPALVSFMFWMFIQAFDGESIGQAVKPASLDLTKVTFTGFMAVSVMAIGNGSNGNHPHPNGFHEHAFILLTSAAVIAGIGWRLLTHRTGQSRAVVVAATVASIWAHACVALAVVPFAVMAFRRAGAPGPVPAALFEA